jgi:predicted SnoaL-like aldol condensation-catalyzing enzyme
MTHKEAAIEFLMLVAAGRVAEAYAAHAGPTFRHHNPHFRADAAALRAGMEDNAIRFPDRTLHVKQALADGDRVAVFSHVHLTPDDAGLALVHLFRFEDGRVAELWDVGQPVPETMVNELGMF